MLLSKEHFDHVHKILSLIKSEGVDSLHQQEKNIRFFSTVS